MIKQVFVREKARKAASDGALTCEQEMPCDGVAVGGACSDEGIKDGEGICKKDSAGMYCAAKMPCDGLAVNAACIDPLRT